MQNRVFIVNKLNKNCLSSAWTITIQKHLYTVKQSFLFCKSVPPTPHSHESVEQHPCPQHESVVHPHPPSPKSVPPPPSKSLVTPHHTSLWGTPPSPPHESVGHPHPPSPPPWVCGVPPAPTWVWAPTLPVTHTAHAHTSLSNWHEITEAPGHINSDSQQLLSLPRGNFTGLTLCPCPLHA